MDARYLGVVSVVVAAFVLLGFATPSDSFRVVSDVQASALIGGDVAACQSFDPDACAGEDDDCVLTGCWKTDSGGAMTNHKLDQNKACGVTDCGSVKKIKSCSKSN